MDEGGWHLIHFLHLYLLASKLSWVIDPTSFVAMKLDMHFRYFTKLSVKSLDFYFLVGTHLNFNPSMDK